jgi:hypothetical protein
MLYGIATVMSLAAALAIGILLFGDFGGTEGRILLTTLVLAGFGALSVPAAILWDQGRRLPLAAACAALAAAGAVLAVTGIWANTDNETFGKVVSTVMFFLVPTVATTALAARPLHRLFVPSVAVAYTVATLGAAAMWTETESGGLLRLLGALVVLAVLLFALQPLLLRARRERAERTLRLVDDEGEVLEVVVLADTLANAAAQAIRTAEREGRHVRSIDVLDGPRRTFPHAGSASRPMPTGSPNGSVRA